jgi:hypothetical protein
MLRRARCLSLFRKNDFSFIRLGIRPRHIVDATGRYAGLKGQGELEGTLNFETGGITDVFEGWVHLPKP